MPSVPLHRYRPRRTGATPPGRPGCPGPARKRRFEVLVSQPRSRGNGQAGRPPKPDCRRPATGSSVIAGTLRDFGRPGRPPSLDPGLKLRGSATARIFAAERPALSAPGSPMASVPTGTPGICTMECNASHTIERCGGDRHAQHRQSGQCRGHAGADAQRPQHLQRSL